MKRLPLSFLPLVWTSAACTESLGPGDEIDLVAAIVRRSGVLNRQS